MVEPEITSSQLISNFNWNWNWILNVTEKREENKFGTHAWHDSNM